jgi:hypothetical protein
MQIDKWFNKKKEECSADIEAPSQAQASYRNSAFRRLLFDVHETSAGFVPSYLRMLHGYDTLATARFLGHASAQALRGRLWLYPANRPLLHVKTRLISGMYASVPNDRT